MATNFYDLGTLTSATTTSPVTIQEAYDGHQGIFRYYPSDDANLTIKLQGSDDGGSSWTDVQAISDPDYPYAYKVTLYRQMRLNCTAFTAGKGGGAIEPL